jgi:hypothetical protein
LLTEIEKMAEAAKLQAVHVEAPESKKFLDLLVPQLRKVVLKLDRGAKMRADVNRARGALRNFASVIKVKLGEFEFGIEPEPGVADSGDLGSDLTDLFVEIGGAAKASDSGVVILLDEVQYLSAEELSATIVALHRVSQKNLPLIMVGAGLPQLAALAGEAKSYAERLFDYPSVGPLGATAAAEALRKPIEEANAAIEPAALKKIVKQTKGYPFFLQEWGFQAWNAASGNTITSDVIAAASKAALARLDRGFFKVRLDRMTPREQDYMRAMAELGEGPHRSGDIAKEMGIGVRTAGPLRTGLINKGMIYSPAYGETAFTVPMFDEYLRRAIFRFDPQVKTKSAKSKRKD